MITLNSDGHWFEFFDKYDFYPTNLCSLFWTAVLLPSFLTTMGLLISLALIYSLLGWFHIIALFFGVPFPLEGTTGMVILAVVIIEAFMLATWFIISAGTAAGKKIGKVAETTGTTDVVRQAYHGFKDKYCPLVEWK